MAIQRSGGKALVLTVGTGNVDDIERTLLVPVLKSIEAGDWNRVVLLPSRLTEVFARALQERASSPAVTMDPLPERGQENDADACFGHFDQVLEQLGADGFRPGDIVVDFTRGTKAMSAALVLAATGRNVPILRYVHGERRDERGMVVPGTEAIGEIRTTLATARRRLDRAAHLMRCGDFSAVIEFLPDRSGPFARLFPERFRVEARALRAAAEIYAAWDRLDYRNAVEMLDRCGETAAGAGEFATTPAMRGWLRRLARKPEQDRHEEMAAYLRALACDLLANAERRLRDRHFEDALLRAYRVLELVGQIRLFDRGYDSASLPEDDERIRAFRQYLRKKKSHDFGRNRGKLTAPRELAARFLKRLGDPIAPRLLRFDARHGESPTRSRNHSVLVHGFTAKAPPEETPLREVLDDLGRLLREDEPGAAARLDVARSLSFG